MTQFMKIALMRGKEALVAQEVPVGCIFTINGEIIAQSQNTVNETHNPTRHAELNCIDQVLDLCKSKKIDFHDYFKNIIVYVTVEPCIMCAAALNNLKVKQVIYGCPNDRFGGKTVIDVSVFYEQTYLLAGDLLADEAMSLLKEFYSDPNPNAPEAKVKKLKTI